MTELANLQRPADTPRPTRILIVEDEGIVAWDIEQNLMELGFEVTGVAASGAEALDATASSRPDLVLMDVRIQGPMDGIEVAARLQQDFGIPVIYLTAHGDGETVARAKRTQPLGYLLKPFKKAELLSAVEVAVYRHGMEKQLRERERWLSTTLRSIGDGVITTDTAGNVTFLNRVAESLTGWQYDCALGRSYQEVLHIKAETSDDVIEAPFLEAMASRSTVTIPLGRLISRDGEEYCIMDSASPVMDDDQVYGAVMVFRDITEQRAMQRQIELSDRLASLGTMAAGIAHEVNNPLVFIMANIDFALGELRHLEQVMASSSTGTAAIELAKIQEALNEAHQGTKRVSKIVTDLKSFARGNSGSHEMVDVLAPLNWAISVTEHEWRQCAALKQDLGPLPLVAADEVKIGQVFINLILNAAQSFETTDIEKNCIRIQAFTDPQGFAVISIGDNGIGISAAIIHRLFEPFFTTKAKENGTGLGLPVCHSIVQSLGGSLEVTSAAGEGSTFTVRLPHAAPQATSITQTQTPAPQPVSQRGEVLVVDDEELVRRAIERTLERVHNVTAVHSATEALKLIAQGIHFDLILCDVMMPTMNGIAFYKKLAENYPLLAPHVLFLSGGIAAKDEEHFLRSLSNTRIQKPFVSRELLRLVMSLISAAQAERAAP